jgi:aspartate aminotransferase-like enzyme
MARIRLFTPGPVMIPDEVLLEAAQPLEHHRTQVYQNLLKEVVAGLQYVFQTSGPCFVIAGSGTSGMEGAIVSCARPGRKALVCDGGKFGERWGKVCDAFGIERETYKIEWGRGAKAEKIADYLAKDKSIGMVVVVHSETSTAAVSELEQIAKLTRNTDVLLITDAITSAGAIPLKTDEWGVDVVVTGSQKALMNPPGLAYAAVGKKAQGVIESIKPKAFYLSFKAYLKSLADNDAPYTPAISLVRSTHKALQMIKAEGLEKIWSRTSRLARATRAAAVAMGLQVFPKDPVDSLTAILMPESVKVSPVRKTLQSKYGVHVADGQDQLKGKVIRISHMGSVDEYETIGAIGALELTLKEMGWSFKLGSGLGAAQEILAGV